MTLNFYLILLSLAVAVAAVFIVLFIQSRRAYKKLLKKNLQNQENTFRLSEKIDFENVKTQTSADRDLVGQLQVLFEEQKVYLEPDININVLAKKMGTSRGVLSHVINQYFHKSFPALLNQYRVNEALRLLTDKSSKDYKLEVIGEMCGYRNRQVFHSAFKRETGITPNHFRKVSEG